MNAIRLAVDIVNNRIPGLALPFAAGEGLPNLGNANGSRSQLANTVAEQRAANIHVRDGTGEEEFVAMRTARDATLEVPTLILPSLQVNVRAGQRPKADENGVVYLRIPINTLPVNG